MLWKECHVMDERLRFVAPPARGREDGAPVRRVRDLAQDGLQDLRALQGLRRCGVYRSQPAPLSPGQSTAAAAGSGDCTVQAVISRLGGAEDPREVIADDHR